MAYEKSVNVLTLWDVLRTNDAVYLDDFQNKIQYKISKNLAVFKRDKVFDAESSQNVYSDWSSIEIDEKIGFVMTVDKILSSNPFILVARFSDN